MIKFNSGVISFARSRGALFSALLLFGVGMQPAYAAASGTGGAKLPHVVDFAAIQDTEIPVSSQSNGGIRLDDVRVMTSAFTPEANCWNLLGFGLRFKSEKGEHQLILAPPGEQRSAFVEFVGVAGKVTVAATGKGAPPPKQVAAGDSTVEVTWDGPAPKDAMVTVTGAGGAKFTVKKLTLE